MGALTDEKYAGEKYDGENPPPLPPFSTNPAEIEVKPGGGGGIGPGGAGEKRPGERIDEDSHGDCGKLTNFQKSSFIVSIPQERGDKIVSKLLICGKSVGVKDMLPFCIKFNIMKDR